MSIFRWPRSLALTLCVAVIPGCHKPEATRDPSQAAQSQTGQSQSGQSQSGQSQAVPPQPDVSSLSVATAALARGDRIAAESAIAKHLLVQPADPVGLEVAGDIASASGNSSQAIDLYRSAIEHSPSPSASMFEKLARQWMTVGSPYEAADVLAESVRKHPNDPKVRADLAGLVASLGMVRDAAEHLRWLLRRGRGGLNELIMLANLNIPQTDEAICNYALKRNPDDLRPRYPLALAAAYEGRWDDVARELAEVTAKHPQFSAAWALYGRALVELDREAALLQWQQRLPPGTDGWATYWVAAGIWAEKQNRPDLAALAFSEAVRRDDCHGEALTHLAANLAQLGRSGDAKRIAKRAEDVNTMHDSVESLFSWRKNSQKAALAIAKAMGQLGRPWEAEAWARASLGMTQEIESGAPQTHRDLRGKLASTTPWQLPELLPLSGVDLSELDEFRWQSESGSTATAAKFTSAAAKIRFVDEASIRGLDHTCAISKSEPEASLWIYQSNAGGAGVIDYDLDGWPDLYLTVLDGRPMQVDSGANRLYRNQSGSFLDVTASVGAGGPWLFARRRRGGLQRRWLSRCARCKHRCESSVSQQRRRDFPGRDR